MNQRLENQSVNVNNYEDPNLMYNNEYSYQHPQYDEIEELEENDDHFASEIDKLKQMFDRNN